MTIGLLERVRDEWQAQNHASVDERFSLIDLLKTLATDRSLTSPADAAATHGTEGTFGGARLGGTAVKAFDATFLARKHYEVDELIGSSDQTFLALAYRCVLKRAPDPIGLEQFMARMHAGTLGRIDVLHALKASFEGRSHGVVIVGLRRRWLWRRAERVRFVGSVFAWLRAIASAAATARRLDALESRIEASHEQQIAVDTTRAKADVAVAALADRFGRLQAESRMQVSAAASQALEAAHRLQRLEEMLGRERVRIEELSRQLTKSAR